jgi:hypothetical protein
MIRVLASAMVLLAGCVWQSASILNVVPPPIKFSGVSADKDR